MSAFPTLIPSSRTFTPGGYPHSTFAGMSGRSNRVRNSNVMLDSQIRLSFLAITESEMLSILAHYQGQSGGFISFSLPSELLSGVTSVSDFLLSGYGWIYTGPPTVEDLPCGGHNVELTLASVPPEGTALLGLSRIVLVTLTAGTATAANGINLIVAASIAGGSAGMPALNETVTVGLSAGAATAGVTAPGAELLVMAMIMHGVPVDATGAALTVTASLAGGTASTATTDPNFSSVSLLLHMNGSNGGTTFTDNSSNAFTITKAAGTVTTSTAQVKYGTAAGDFTTGGRLETPTSAAFTFPGDFTIEAWVRRAGMTGSFDTLLTAQFESTLMIRASTTNPGIFIGAFRYIENVSLDLNTWHHIALVRSGTTLTFYRDGASQGSASYGATIECGKILIGDSSVNGRYFNGFVDDLRITKGIARYQGSSFTVPNAAFPDS